MENCERLLQSFARQAFVSERRALEEFSSGGEMARVVLRAWQDPLLVRRRKASVHVRHRGQESAPQAGRRKSLSRGECRRGEVALHIDEYLP